MLGCLKGFIITILVIALILFLLVVQLGVGIFNVVKETAKASESSVQLAAMDTASRTAVTPEAIIITTTAVPERAILLEGVELCGANIVSPSGYSFSSGSVNGVSKTAIELDDAAVVPAEMTIERRDANGCVRQTLTGLERYVRVMGYYTHVGYSMTQLSQWGISLEGVNTSSYAYSSNVESKPGDTGEPFKPLIQRTANSQFASISATTAKGNTRLTVNYTGLPMQDEFLLGGKRVRLQFGPVPAGL